jgi:hypothetical protein
MIYAQTATINYSQYKLNTIEHKHSVLKKGYDDVAENANKEARFQICGNL